MKLEEYCVRNYRSVLHSDWIEVGKLTALVGRNESGKSNLLNALYSLNPPTRKVAPISEDIDYPRNPNFEPFDPDAYVIETYWLLSDEEQKYLHKLFPRSKGIRRVYIDRTYNARYVGFEDLPELKIEITELEKSLSTLRRSVTIYFKKYPDREQSILHLLSNLSESLLTQTNKPIEWANSAEAAISHFKNEAEAIDAALISRFGAGLSSIVKYIKEVVQDREAFNKARSYIIQNSPIFIYLDEYPELNGHQSITEYLKARESYEPLSETLNNFERLMKVANLDPAELNRLSLDNSYANNVKRQRLTNQAGALVTSKIRDLWSDRKLTIKFDLDGDHFNTLISDADSIYDAEINLNERSRGFRWFFSFYVAFAADTMGGDVKNAVLLLDEPGVGLHAKAQQDLLVHLSTYENQIIYTTHSPFMISTQNIDGVRTVTYTKEMGTTVKNDPISDETTMSPLRAALGYDLSNTLFVGENNLIVEGITDFWYLRIVSDYLKGQGEKGLDPQLVILPGSGTGQILTLATFLRGNNLLTTILLDLEPESTKLQDKIAKEFGADEIGVVLVSEAFSGQPPREADIEDLFDSNVMVSIFEEVHDVELTNIGKGNLVINPNIPRIMRRYNDALATHKYSVDKKRMVKLFASKMETEPAKIMTPDTVERFKRLFEKIDESQQKLQPQKK